MKSHDKRHCYFSDIILTTFDAVGIFTKGETT